MKRVRIAATAELTDGKTVKFAFARDGVKVDGFAACFKGQVVAYENRCRHIPLTLDYADNRFFTPDGQLFICQTHGAVYEPLTGYCVHGPCQGASLTALKTAVIGEEIWLVENE